MVTTSGVKEKQTHVGRNLRIWGSCVEDLKHIAQWLQWRYAEETQDFFKMSKIGHHTKVLHNTRDGMQVQAGEKVTSSCLKSPGEVVVIPSDSLSSVVISHLHDNYCLWRSSSLKSTLCHQIFFLNYLCSFQASTSRKKNTTCDNMYMITVLSEWACRKDHVLIIGGYSSFPQRPVVHLAVVDQSQLLHILLVASFPQIRGCF